MGGAEVLLGGVAERIGHVGVAVVVALDVDVHVDGHQVGQVQGGAHSGSFSDRGGSEVSRGGVAQLGWRAR